MEYSGAERGLLFLHQENNWILVAELSEKTDGMQWPNVMLSLDSESHLLSIAMLRYVVLTRESVVLRDASLQGPFVRDSYVLKILWRTRGWVTGGLQSKSQRVGCR